MATHRQGMVEAVVTARGFGSSDSPTLASAFPASPIHRGDLNDVERVSTGQTALLDGITNDAGHTFSEFNRDYSENGAPDIDEVATGGGGLPGTPYMPNPSSPEDGFDHTTIPDPPDGWGDGEPNTWGTGIGSKEQPSQTSANISAHTLGDYGLGKQAGSGTGGIEVV